MYFSALKCLSRCVSFEFYRPARWEKNTQRKQKKKENDHKTINISHAITQPKRNFGLCVYWSFTRSRSARLRARLRIANPVRRTKRVIVLLVLFLMFLFLVALSYWPIRQAIGWRKINQFYGGGGVEEEGCKKAYEITTADADNKNRK